MSVLRLSVIVIALSAFSAGAFAQGTPQQRAACRPDVTKFCKGKGEDPGVILGCLEANKDKISEKCRKVIAEADEAPSPASAQKKDSTEPAASAEKKEEKK
jgi:hypothetical protein